MLKRLCLLSALLCYSVAAFCASPELPGIRAAVQAAIDTREVSGAVTVVATKDKVLHLEADGLADIATGKAMQTDSRFWIASRTKPVTAVAVLMLQRSNFPNSDASGVRRAFQQADDDALDKPAGPDFGPNVLVFDPSTTDIQEQIDAVFARQERSQFGSERYAILLKPGAYNLDVQVGFYTQVLGLGRSPDDVAITGAPVPTPAPRITMAKEAPNAEALESPRV